MKNPSMRALSFVLALCLCLALFATAIPQAAAETPIKKVRVQTGNGGTPPVVWLELQYFPTNTSTEGAYISFAQWYYSDGSPVVGSFKDRSSVYLVVEVSASPGYMFPDDVICFINGSETTHTKLSDTCVQLVSHMYTPEVWAAAVYKDPESKVVEPDGSASFVVSGGYVQDYQWCIRTPDKRHWYTLDEARSAATAVNDPNVPRDFLQVTWSGDGTDRLTLNNIPADLDGYYIFCRLSSYDQISWTVSGDAKITVYQPLAEPDRSLNWSKAFGDESLPEGSLTPEEIAFYSAGDEGKPEILNVRREEVLAWWNEQESLPRTRYFEQFMPEKLQDLYPILDYAFAHSCSRFCVPTTTFTATDVAGGWKYLPLTYRINNNGISTLTPAVFDLGGGKTLQYVTVTIKGMDKQGVMSEYQESLKTAREIVAGIPEDSSEYDKALYLYQWLTDNVKYFSDGAPLEYYETEWNLLYDTLVKKDTVCAGYAEALYVLYNLAGIECFTISGAIYSGGEWGGHIWNVAKVDGTYYQFDATWDTGSPPEYYCFFGVSEDTMQSFYPRLLMGDPQEYCPPCTEDLPLPGGGTAALPEELQPGTVEDGVYSQPFFDLVLRPDDSWIAYNREEINELYYGGMNLDMKTLIRLGLDYMDLVLDREDAVVQVMMESSPVRTQNGEICSDAKSYMDDVALTLPEVLRSTGIRNSAVSRYQMEICGRSYEVLSVTGKVAWTRTNVTYYCTERDGVFLMIYIVSGYADNDVILAELLGS